MKRDFKILIGDATAMLKTLPDASVHCCVTSPPYFGLRDYGVDGQIGLESSPEEFVARLVEVFREVRRVLHPTGTLWMNLGPSYSNSVPNVADCLNSILKTCLIVILDSASIATTTECVNVSSDDERSPYREFSGFLGPQRECVKNRNNDFHQIIDLLAVPRDRRTAVDRSGAVLRDCSASNVAFQVVDSRGVIFSDLNSNLKPEFAVLRPRCARSGESNNASLTVEEASEPRAKCVVAWHSTWDSFSLAASGKGVPDIYLMKQPVSLRDGFHSLACLLGDFKVTKASQEKVTLTSVFCGTEISIENVGHLNFSMQDGSVVPYATLYLKAIRMSNKYCAKQEIDTPQMVKDAMQEDGWICRQTIIWEKPNPMPESVTDRCTKSHEYIFLLTKAPTYFCDMEAIKEKSVTEDNRRPYGSPGANALDPRGKQGDGQLRGKGGKNAFRGQGHFREDRNGPANRDGRDMQDVGAGLTRNKRSVWTVATQSFQEAHFATFPPKLVEPCILAGTSAKGCCPHCLAPWQRITERTAMKIDRSKRTHEKGRTRSSGTMVEPPTSKTLGWGPTCDCPAHEPIPCTVLDPFGGAGTTILVATEFGRAGIACELNPEYAEMMRRRVKRGMNYEAPKLVAAAGQSVLFT